MPILFRLLLWREEYLVVFFFSGRIFFFPASDENSRPLSRKKDDEVSPS